MLAQIIAMLVSTGALAAKETDAGLSPAGYLSFEGYLQLPDDFNSSLNLDGWHIAIDDQYGLRFQPAAATLGAWISRAMTA